jgi:hypothetical protein
VVNRIRREVVNLTVFTTSLLNFKDFGQTKLIRMKELTDFFEIAKKVIQIENDRSTNPGFSPIF